MNRPTLEVANIIRATGNSFIERNRRHLCWAQLKVLKAIRDCRTAALGGHLDRCSRCGHQAISYNSCRNRHCPKCQTNAREQWLAKRSQDLLSVPYFHLVFTLPHELSAVVLQNKKPVYDLLFRASAATMLKIAADPKHLGAEVGFLSVLHTWGQNLQHHPHIHCVIPAGGLAPDGSRWVRSSPSFFLPVRVLSAVFRGKFVAGLKSLFERGKLSFHGSLRNLGQPKLFRSFLRQLFRQRWIVYAKRPFGGSEHVLQYLARYTHRVAISNHRLIAFDNDNVTFRWKDYAHGNKKRKMTVTADEFLRRFLLHVLPRGFVRIRTFGFLANRKRAVMIPLCRKLLTDAPCTRSPTAGSAATAFWFCPHCGANMILAEKLTAQQIRFRSVLESFIDSSELAITSDLDHASARMPVVCLPFRPATFCGSSQRVVPRLRPCKTRRSPACTDLNRRSDEAPNTPESEANPIGSRPRASGFLQTALSKAPRLSRLFTSAVISAAALPIEFYRVTGSSSDGQPSVSDVEPRCRFCQFAGAKGSSRQE